MDRLTAFVEWVNEWSLSKKRCGIAPLMLLINHDDVRRGASCCGGGRSRDHCDASNWRPALMRRVRRTYCPFYRCDTALNTSATRFTAHSAWRSSFAGIIRLWYVYILYLFNMKTKSYKLSRAAQMIDEHFSELSELFQFDLQSVLLNSAGGSVTL